MTEEEEEKIREIMEAGEGTPPYEGYRTEPVGYGATPATSADERACDHAAVMPTFDQEAAKNLGAYEIRKKWPRFHGACPTCGESVILYASFAHYLYGDW